MSNDIVDRVAAIQADNQIARLPTDTPREAARRSATWCLMLQAIQQADGDRQKAIDWFVDQVENNEELRLFIFEDLFKSFWEQEHQ